MNFVRCLVISQLLSLFLDSTYSQQSDPESDNSDQFVESVCYSILQYDIEENVQYVKNENYRRE